MAQGTISGTVEELTQREEGVSILLSKAVFVKEDEVNSYQLGKVFIYSKEIILAPGMRVSATGTLSNFQKPSNPGEFNSYYYYGSKGISCKMQADYVDLLDSKTNKFSIFLQKGKNAMIQVYHTWLPKDKAGLLSAMFLGDKQGLIEETERLYQKSGIAHLLAENCSKEIICVSCVLGKKTYIFYTQNTVKKICVYCQNTVDGIMCIQ